jgi:uncharacterized protein YuzE
MKVIFDAKTDSLTVVLKEGVSVAVGDEGKPGVILDYAEQGDLLSLEILDASRRVTRRAQKRISDYGLKSAVPHSTGTHHFFLEADFFRGTGSVWPWKISVDLPP